MASKSTKKDLVQHIAKALEVSPVEAERVMLVVMRYVRRQLLEETSVILPGIGTLAVTETAARLGRNPHTGQPVPIPPRKTIKLKVSKDLKEAMEPSETVRTGGADFDAQKLRRSGARLKAGPGRKGLIPRKGRSGFCRTSWLHTAPDPHGSALRRCPHLPRTSGAQCRC